jgi:hypothetical protein
MPKLSSDGWFRHVSVLWRKRHKMAQLFFPVCEALLELDDLTGEPLRGDPSRHG